MFTIEFTPDAVNDLKYLDKSDQQTVLDAIQRQLAFDATTATRNRKQLRSNPLSTWELRVGLHRVFYNVDEAAQTVTVVAVGSKDHNKLYIRGKEFEL